MEQTNHDILEYNNFLTFVGPNIQELRQVLYRHDSDDAAQDMLFERLVQTPIRYLTSAAQTDAAEYRKRVWGPSKDAYGVSLFPDNVDEQFFRFFTEGCPPIPLLEQVTGRFALKANLTYVSEEAEVAGVEVWENGKNVRSLRFENDGFEILLDRILANGGSLTSVWDILFEEEKERFYVGIVTPDGGLDSFFVA